MLNANDYTTHRRGFLARLAAGSVALGLGAIPSPLRAASAGVPTEESQVYRDPMSGSME